MLHLCKTATFTKEYEIRLSPEDYNIPSVLLNIYLLIYPLAVVSIQQASQTKTPSIATEGIKGFGILHC